MDQIPIRALISSVYTNLMFREVQVELHDMNYYDVVFLKRKGPDIIYKVSDRVFVKDGTTKLLEYEVAYNPSNKEFATTSSTHVVGTGIEVSQVHEMEKQIGDIREELSALKQVCYRWIARKQRCYRHHQNNDSQCNERDPNQSFSTSPTTFSATWNSKA
ncbi:unnamed protein product [Dovyalis caffra]|uniref:Uncharacterized protein n=1 Tax=Dovyalis caffra TaxID=77055 RepID=A0AAV1R793_9ROSI|nr:unnamed protein product [Dovyalis caffra]